jgi:oxygen-independent coproporphyrinogen-3 oxidase
MELVTLLTGRGQRISHLHFGGGTPTFMLDEEFARLFDAIGRHFEFAPDGEYSIEVDPRTVTPARLWTLRALGLNRVSLGIQDFDPEVQKAVNRVQSCEDTRALIETAREAGFHSINVDLIYGLPRQTVEGFERTLDQTIAANPDRVALYHYAHLPQLFKPQRRIREEELPSGETRARLFDMAVAKFRGAGYAYLGLDHFARADDELAVAQREGRLHRNFQGYCSHDAGDLVALGVSSISAVGSVYVQNEKSLDGYYTRIAHGELPIIRGIALGSDDFVRRDVIQSLMCNFRIWWPEIEASHRIVARQYFADALAELAPMHDAGAIRIHDDGIDVLPRGRLLVRAVAMAFDRYLKHAPAAGTYSKIA